MIAFFSTRLVPTGDGMTAVETERHLVCTRPNPAILSSRFSFVRRWPTVITALIVTRPEPTIRR